MCISSKRINIRNLVSSSYVGIMDLIQPYPVVSLARLPHSQCVGLMASRICSIYRARQSFFQSESIIIFYSLQKSGKGLSTKEKRTFFNACIFKICNSSFDFQSEGGGLKTLVDCPLKKIAFCGFPKWFGILVPFVHHTGIHSTD